MIKKLIKASLQSSNGQAILIMPSGDTDITAEEFKCLQDSFVRCISCFEPQTPEDNSVVCKRCLSRLHPDDLFLDITKDYGLH
jgi:hypothetical protein